MGAGRCGRDRAGLCSLGTVVGEAPAMFARAACVDGILVLSGAVQPAAWTV